MIRLYTGRQRSSQSLTLWRTASARVGVGPWGRAGPRATSAGNTVFPHGAKHATAGLAEPPVSRNDARPNGGAEQRQPHADSSLNVLNDSTLDTDTPYRPPYRYTIQQSHPRGRGPPAAAAQSVCERRRAASDTHRALPALRTGGATRGLTALSRASTRHE